MKTLFLAAAAVLSLGIGSAYADGGGTGPTMFTMIEAQLQTKPAAPARATRTGGPATYVYSTMPQRQGTWLFAPTQNDGGANN
jgi:hypothetical protein